MREHSPVVYTSASHVRTPGLLLKSLWSDLADSRELSWRLFVRDISAQYRQSVLGIVWAFVPPLVTSVIFVFLQSRNVVNFGDIDIPYPVYVIVGTILWQMFVESLNAPVKMVNAAKPMLSKVNFPREALVVASFYTVMYGVLIKSLVLAGVVILFRIPVTWTMLLALLPILMIVLCGICLGLFLTPLSLLYGDVVSGLPVATQLLFFVTPVVYLPPTSFPFSLVSVLNPVSPALMTARDVITKGTVGHPQILLMWSGTILIGLVAGLVIYRTAMPIVIERISA